MQEMKQAESGSLIAPSEIFFEFREVDQTRGEGEKMAPGGESENVCATAWGTAGRIHESNAESKCGL